MKFPADLLDPIRRERHDLEEEIGETPAPRPNYLLHAVLFALTLLTTTMAGAYQSGVDPLKDLSLLVHGLPFSISLMTILTAHEMGHYFTSRRVGVNASLPYFIPAPPSAFLIGTFGAFIKMVPPIRSRSAILNIGLAGPVVGFVFAIVASVIGLTQSTLVAETGGHGIRLGSSIVFGYLTRLVFGPIPDGMDVLLHPVAFAGWFGLFVTALNLIPIGQMDGGHIAYAVLGRHHRTVSMAVIATLVVFGFLGWPGWLIWAMLAAVLGIQHPPVQNPHIPLYPDDRLKAAGGLALLVITFVPVPMSFV